MPDNHQIPEPTGAGVIEFINFAIAKGHLKGSTGASIKSAVKEVLSAVEGEDKWENVNVLELDLDDVQRRFDTLRAMKFTQGSLKTYKQRFVRGVTMFIDFREDPGGWQPAIKTRNRRLGNRPTSASESANQEAATGNRGGGGSYADARERSTAPARPRSGGGMIPYPFPLRPGVLASIELPDDLSSREAERLASFIKSLAVDGIGTRRPAGEGTE